MKTTIKGTDHNVETQTGTSEKGEWKSGDRLEVQTLLGWIQPIQYLV